MKPAIQALAAVAVLGVAVLAWRATRSDGGAGNEPGESDWESLPRVVTVEVLNGGSRIGAARDAALRLRRARLDVVAWGNAPAELKDTLTTTVRVLVRRGHEDAGLEAERLAPQGFGGLRGGHFVTSFGTRAAR